MRLEHNEHFSKFFFNFQNLTVFVSAFHNSVTRLQNRIYDLAIFFLYTKIKRFVQIPTKQIARYCLLIIVSWDLSEVMVWLCVSMVWMSAGSLSTARLPSSSSTWKLWNNRHIYTTISASPLAGSKTTFITTLQFPTPPIAGRETTVKAILQFPAVTTVIAVGQFPTPPPVGCETTDITKPQFPLSHLQVAKQPLSLC